VSELKENWQEENLEKKKEIEIETEPFTKAKIKEDVNKIDFIYNLDSSKKKRIKFWLKKHRIQKASEEEIIYIHRYPSTNETLVGIKRLKNLEYFA